MLLHQVFCSSIRLMASLIACTVVLASDRLGRIEYHWAISRWQSQQLPAPQGAISRKPFMVSDFVRETKLERCPCLNVEASIGHPSSFTTTFPKMDFPVILSFLLAQQIKMMYNIQNELREILTYAISI